MARPKKSKSPLPYGWIPKQGHPGKRPQKNEGLYHEEPKDTSLNLSLTKTAKGHFAALASQLQLSRSEILERILRDDECRAIFFDLAQRVGGGG